MFINVSTTKLYMHFTKIFWVCKGHVSGSPEMFVNTTGVEIPHHFSFAFDEAEEAILGCLDGR